MIKAPDPVTTEDTNKPEPESENDNPGPGSDTDEPGNDPHEADNSYPTGVNDLIDGRALNEKQNMALVAMAMMYTEPGKAVYVYGADGTDANGDGVMEFDCSGFVRYIYKQNGIEFENRTCAGLYNNESCIQHFDNEEDLQPGDLIFMKNPTDGIHHVVIYAGGGMVVEAANSKKGMKYRSLDEWRGEELLFAKVVKN